MKARPMFLAAIIASSTFFCYCLPVQSAVQVNAVSGGLKMYE